MKTVGIITTHRLPNYGSVLQAYSLQQVIRNLGYKVKIIDYRYPNEFHKQRGGTSWRMKKKDILVMRTKMTLRPILEILGLRAKTKMDLLNKFISKEMNCTRLFKSYTDLHKNPPIFDIYVTGSDQIWNPYTMLGDMSYMFDFAPDGSKIISYASSFSCDKIPFEYQADYKKYLMRYSSISVREANGVRIVKDLTGRNDAKLVIDPTLLLDKKSWNVLANKARKLDLPSKYILCYKLAYTYNPDKKMNEILYFLQEKYKLPIVTFTPLPGWKGGEMIFLSERKYSVGIYEFLNLFRNAEIIASSSFHGTAFALNFGRPFLALTKSNKQPDDRIATLLNLIDLESQLVTTETNLNGNTNPFYNITKEQNVLNQLRNKSMMFLSDIL